MAITYHYGKFPPPNLEWDRIIPLIGPASAAIAYYDGILGGIPKADILLAPLTTQEAVLSSRIEGTQATMGEVLEYEAGTSEFHGERKSDIHEILNYRRAMREAEHRLHELPLSQRLLREIHQTLMSGVRGQKRAPGEYRKTLNWIGPPGCKIEEAHFVPISADKLPQAMTIWEKFIHTDFPDKLVQLGLLHVEFEALHPFLDGNGRLGRIFIPLYLWQQGLISRPNFYISEFFESNRADYYEKLRSVSEYGTWTDWCVFFLEAVKTQAFNNGNKAKNIIALHEELKKAIPEIVKSPYNLQIVDGLFSTPIFTSAGFAAANHIALPTVRRLVSLLLKAGIIDVLKSGSGNQAGIYVFSRLLAIAE